MYFPLRRPTFICARRPIFHIYRIRRRQKKTMAVVPRRRLAVAALLALLALAGLGAAIVPEPCTVTTCASGQYMTAACVPGVPTLLLDSEGAGGAVLVGNWAQTNVLAVRAAAAAGGGGAGAAGADRRRRASWGSRGCRTTTTATTRPTSRTRRTPSTSGWPQPTTLTSATLPAPTAACASRTPCRTPALRRRSSSSTRCARALFLAPRGGGQGRREVDRRPLLFFYTFPR